MADTPGYYTKKITHEEIIGMLQEALKKLDEFMMREGVSPSPILRRMQKEFDEEWRRDAFDQLEGDLRKSLTTTYYDTRLLSGNMFLIMMLDECISYQSQPALFRLVNKCVVDAQESDFEAIHILMAFNLINENIEEQLEDALFM